MEQNWELRNKPTHIWTNNLLENSKEHTTETLSSTDGVGKQDSHMQKNKIRLLSKTYKKNLKVNYYHFLNIFMGV